jgi:hypothetical protein
MVEAELFAFGEANGKTKRRALGAVLVLKS